MQEMSGMLKYGFIVATLLLGSCLWAQDQTVELKNLGNQQVSVAGFILSKDSKVHIKAIGAGYKHEFMHFRSFQADPNSMFAYAWILDAQTRKMVWRMTLDNTKRIGHSGYNRKFEGDVQLPKGTYEVYFSSVEPIFFTGGGFISLHRLLKKIVGTNSEWDEEAEDWIVRISGVDEALDVRDVRKEQTQYLNKTIVHLVHQGDDSFEKVGFSLKEKARLQIYAQGEGFKSKMFDYGWIIDARTNERIWLMEEEQTEYGGGAEKNRVVRQTIEFKPGDYLVYYKTDDSHSAEEWNANPPYDPFFWGIVVRPAQPGFDWSKVGKLSRRKSNAVVNMTQIGDYAYKEAFIKVNKPTKIRISCLGEGRNGEMFDYGWISRAEDGKIVWKMDFDQTRHAGGSSKNRLFDGIITLQPGTYVVHYQTDDSHSYEGWNAEPPQQPDMWGIVIYNLGPKDAIKAIARPGIDQKNVLVRLIQVGDDEFLKKDIYLNEPTQIRIYCLGEGDENGMYDYGWIKNVETGDTVWKMRFKNTVHAGGAEKNRLADTIITLKPGHYRVYYKSDDSHSYRHWNAPAPYDERNYGITLYRLN